MPHFGAPSEKVLVNGVPGDQVTDRHGEQAGQRLRVSILTHPPSRQKSRSSCRHRPGPGSGCWAAAEWTHLWASGQSRLSPEMVQKVGGRVWLLAGPLARCGPVRPGPIPRLSGSQNPT